MRGLIRPGAALATGAWLATGLADWRAFRAALAEPARAQARVRAEIERSLGGSPALPGRIDDREPAGWESIAPLMARATDGEAVLGRQSIERFVPTSGSAAAIKLVPSTPLLRRQFARGVHAWVVDLYRRRPHLLAGPAYWSISPAVHHPPTAGGIPVGFAEDSAWLGRAAKHLVDRALAVPGAVCRLAGQDFVRATALLLLAEPALRLVSVWNPTFLVRIVRHVDEHREDLARALHDGITVCGRRLRRRRIDRPWPRLGLVSCWTDAHAAAQVEAVRGRFPDAEIQPKGLLATEALVSLPFGDARPLAITSHYLEFELDDGRLKRAEELAEGDQATVVVSTGGGLVRYRLHDRVEVTGFLARTPCIRFLGRGDRVSDLVGEKLHDAFVTAVLDDLGVRGFSLLAPDGAGYTLYAERPPPVERLEAGLARNVHYRWAVSVGQLRPARVFHVEGDPGEAYLRAMQERGQRLGDVKPAALDTRDGWSGRFRGAYATP